jgi:phenylpyruvate tautomerase PptA (4-oxalocrotonate tautomerase family)
MPMIDLTLPRDALAPEARAKLVDDLTAALLRWEGAPDNEATRSISWAFVHELPEGGVNVGGHPAERPRYRIQLTVPEGTPKLHGPLSEESRNGLVEEATRLVLEAEGAPFDFENAMRVWVHIHELPDGAWGGAGRIFRMKDIAAFATGRVDGAKSAREPVAAAT